MEDEWPTGLLCKGCSRALELPVRNWKTGEVEPVFEGREDVEGSFIRCLHCGGKHYYALDEKGKMRLRYFKPGTRLFYGWRRKMGLLGPDD